MIFNNLFAKYLIDNNVIDKNQINPILKICEDISSPLYIELSKNNVLDEETIYLNLANYLNLDYHGFQLTEVNFELVSKFPREKIIEFKAVPYEEKDDAIVFAIANPFRIEELGEFKLYTSKKIEYFIVTNERMDQLIRYIDNKIQQNTVLSDFSSSDLDITDATDDDGNISIDAPIIKLCDSILKDAISRGASDIHIEPFTNEITIRYRIDGHLVVIDRVATHLYQSILARYKIMSEMNIAERRIPQDGKINMTIENMQYDFRVSTIPTINGEKIVIRIYNITLSSANLTALGFNEKQKNLVIEMITRPHGIVLMTGPTGSGKSTSLYAFLRYLNKEDTNIITVEDPVENQINGINQVQVNPKANLTFATALRSILRQDPNVIMIGEIRDEETAQIATRAAITGHLVLSTIHTNDAAGVVTRLINMGIPPYLVADALLGSISQRLVRKLCPKCRQESTTTKVEMKMLGLTKPAKIYRQCGCKACNNTGYAGRIGVFEILVVNDDVKNAIMSDDFTSDMLNKIVANNMTTILGNAKERVLAGETSIEEYEKLSEVVEIK